MCLKFMGIRWSVTEQDIWHLLLGTRVCTYPCTGAHNIHTYTYSENNKGLLQNKNRTPKLLSTCSGQVAWALYLYEQLIFPTTLEASIILFYIQRNWGFPVSEIQENLGSSGTLVSHSLSWCWTWPAADDLELSILLLQTPKFDGKYDHTWSTQCWESNPGLHVCYPSTQLTTSPTLEPDLFSFQT